MSIIANAVPPVEHHAPITKNEAPFVLSSHKTFQFASGTVNAVLVDIEGTTTAISFVHKVLFPYAKQNVGQYLREHEHLESVQKIIEEVKSTEKLAHANLEEVTKILVTWMEQDKKITPLKTLQGMMWEDGYKTGAFKGHVYEDANRDLRQWKEQGIPLYVYSSGSVQAQQLLYGHSDFGDMTPLFTDYFDTKVGGKKEAASYLKIAEKIGMAASSVLFLTDSVDELNAAKAAGMQTLLLCRDGIPEGAPADLAISSFDQIEIGK